MKKKTWIFDAHNNQAGYITVQIDGPYSACEILIAAEEEAVLSIGTHELEELIKKLLEARNFMRTGGEEAELSCCCPTLLEDSGEVAYIAPELAPFCHRCLEDVIQKLLGVNR